MRTTSPFASCCTTATFTGLCDLHALRRLVGRVARGRRVQRDAVRARLDMRDDHLDRVALLHDLARVLDALHREIAGVDQPVDPRLELDERPERLQAARPSPCGACRRAYFFATSVHGSGIA